MSPTPHRRYRAFPTCKPTPAFTLIEVMIAMLVLVLGILSATYFLAGVTRATVFTHRVTEATAIGQAKLEELVAYRTSSLSGGSDTFSGYQRAWTVTPTSGVYVAAITVSWSDIDGNQRHISLQTALHR